MHNTAQIVAAQHAYFAKGKPKNITHRLVALRRLRGSIQTHEKDILAALHTDLNKAPGEAYATEISLVLHEIHTMERKLARWARPKRVYTPLHSQPASTLLMAEPYGVVLVMAPWNYPFQLTLSPLVGALAAGNCVVLKPSNYAPATSAVIADIVAECFPPEYVAVVQGGREQNTSLLAQKFDYIFFTGGVAVGKVVMRAAAENLTPVSLELGGKSPCIVDNTADLALAAKRIAWGKCINAGQTCVAPDYILCHHSVRDVLVELIWQAVVEFYGKAPHLNPAYPKIINDHHFARLQGLMAGGKISHGGISNAATRQLCPTILTDVSWDDPVMGEEIFGPILPVLTFTTLDEAIEQVNARPKPLAFYGFTTDSLHEKRMLNEISFGGGCINDTIMHMVSNLVPFGGVGNSGMGAYHGKYSFDTFSHKKTVLRKSNLLDVPLRYPPYSKGKMALIKRFMG